MKFIKSIVYALVGVAAYVKAAPAGDTVKTISFTNDDGNSTTNYTLVDIEWAVPMNDSDAPYNLTVVGSIQDVLSNITAADPATGARIHAIFNATRNNTESDLEARDYTPIDWFCNVNRGKLGRATSWYIADGMDYLRTVPGSPKNGPGPGACGRVSCSYNSGIYWCNDNNHDYILDSYSDIADGAQLVLDHCRVGGGFLPGGVVNGQQFYEGGWNVFLHGDTC